jgi:hypothetical protein
MAVRLLQLLLFAGCVVVFAALGLVTFKSSRYAACSEAAAYESVKDGLRGVLLAPQHAIFPTLGEVRIERSGSCTFRVRGYVDSANLLGVLLRAEYQARIERDATGQVRMRLDGLVTREEVAPLVLPPAEGADSARREDGTAGPESRT